MLRKFLSLVAILGSAAVSSAQTFVAFNFNSPTPDGNVATGTLTASGGTGTVSLIGGVTSTFASGSPTDPAATDNSGLNTTTYPALSAASGTAGIRVNTSTVTTVTPGGALTIQFDFRQSGTASRFWQLQASSDGTNFTNVSGGTATVTSAPSPNTATSFDNTGLYSNNSGSGSQQFVQGLKYTFASGSVYENNPNFAFRWVSIFDPAGTSYVGSNATYSTSGTARFDTISVSYAAAPEPTLLLGAGLLGVAVVRRRRA